MNKRITIRGIILGALLSGIVLCSIGAVTRGSRPAWEYRVLGGYTQQLNAPPGASLLDPLLKTAGEEGWEAVSWAQAGESPPYYRVLLKRAKQ